MKLTRILSCVLATGLADYGRSNDTEIVWKWDPDNTQLVLFAYYTTMDIHGDVWAHFKMGLTEVESLPPEWNSRLGFGFRPF